jgi:hypothetical protein
MPDRVLHTKLDGPGLFRFEVAAQNHYQPAILQLLQNRFQESAALESTAQSAEYYVTAILRSEPSNPHDCNAIAVEISGLKVGHLDRHTAAKLTNQCKRLGFDQIAATCKAKLSGYRSHGEQAAKVNVMLDKKPRTVPERWRAAFLIQSKPKRSVLRGLVNSLAVGYGLNEIAQIHFITR